MIQGSLAAGGIAETRKRESAELLPTIEGRHWVAMFRARDWENNSVRVQVRARERNLCRR